MEYLLHQVRGDGRVEQRWWLQWEQKEERGFPAEALLPSHFLLVFTLRSSVGNREMPHTILKGAALFQKEIANQGGRPSSSGVREAPDVVPFAVLFL